MNLKRLYISADIEGVAGVVSREQLMPSGFEYQNAREWMTAELVAACISAFDSGIEEVVVSDSHGNGQNILLDELPSRVQLVRSWPRPLCMMEGIQEGDYVGAVLLGYHSGATQGLGVLAHTLSGAGIREIKLNGQVASETVISAATAAHFKVPVIMVSGDDAYIRHAEEVLGPVESVVTKWVSSDTSARTLRPIDAQKKVAEGLALALSKLPIERPQPLSEDIEIEIDCVKRSAAALLDYLPFLERKNSHTIHFIGKDMVVISKFLSFLISSNVLNGS